MKSSIAIGLGVAVSAAIAVSSFTTAAAQAPAAPAAAAAPAVPTEPPMVPPAEPGVFKAEKRGAAHHLVVAGKKLTSRSDVEKYLAYRAAELTLEQGGAWFTFSELRGKGETADPAPKADPRAPRHSFRMRYFRPVWRYKVSGSPDWKPWSPFSGAPWNAEEAARITDFEVSADIVIHKGQMDDTNPLGFEARAVSDLLINQVSPPSLRG
jgi:hypothetical protein